MTFQEPGSMHDADLVIRPLALPRFTVLRLQRASDDALRQASAALDFELARTANMWSEGKPKNARLARTEWLIIDGPSPSELAVNLQGIFHHAQEITAGKVGWAVAGASAADLIANGCSLDLHPSVFRPRAVTRTLVAHVPATLSRPGPEPLFEIVTDRSLQTYFESWLADVAAGRAPDQAMPGVVIS
jgi:sarcosine oxidase subunit gamma